MPQHVRCAEHQHQRYKGLRGEEDDGGKDGHAELAEVLQSPVTVCHGGLDLRAPPRRLVLAVPAVFLVFFFIVIVPSAARLFLCPLAVCRVGRCAFVVLVLVPLSTKVETAWCSAETAWEPSCSAPAVSIRVSTSTATREAAAAKSSSSTETTRLGAK